MQANRMLVVSAAILLACPAALFAQQKQSTWLRTGAVWQYYVTQTNVVKPKSVEAVVHTVTAESVANMPDGRELHQLRVGRGKGGVISFALWSVHDGQIEQHANKSMLRRGALDDGAASMQILRRSGANATSRPSRWQWQGPMIGADVGSGNRAGESGRGTWSHTAQSLGSETITVPAGQFLAEHIRIRSEQEGSEPFLRDIWLALEVGVVCEERRCGKSRRVQRLKEFTPGGSQDDTVIEYLEDRLQRRQGKPFNNTPRVTWLEAGPEALLVAGRIAAVTTDGGSRTNYLVRHGQVTPFDTSGESGLGVAAYKAFESKTAVPTKHTDLAGLALLLARSEAALLHFGNVHAVPVTLNPMPPLRKSDRSASAQVTGGALDGTQRNIAVWLSYGPRWQVRRADDLPKSGDEEAANGGR